MKKKYARSITDKGSRNNSVSLSIESEMIVRELKKTHSFSLSKYVDLKLKKDFLEKSKREKSFILNEIFILEDELKVLNHNFENTKEEIIKKINSKGKLLKSLSSISGVFENESE